MRGKHTYLFFKKKFSGKIRYSNAPYLCLNRMVWYNTFHVYSVLTVRYGFIKGAGEQ